MHEDNASPLSGNVDRLLHSEHAMVCARPNGWGLIEFRTTGRLHKRSARVGDAQYVAEVPVRAAHRLGNADTLKDLVRLHGKPEREPNEYWVRHGKEPGARHAASRTRDVGVQGEIVHLVHDRILHAAHAATPLDTAGRAPCRNCSGAGRKPLDNCWCKERGAHYLGVLAERDDVLLDDPYPALEAGPAHVAEPATYDPACDECHGTGTYLWTCPVCDGAGVEPVCVDWTVNGPDGTYTFRHDIASLIRDGHIRLHVDALPVARGIEVRVRTDCRPLRDTIEQKVASGQPAWLRTGTHFHDWNLDSLTGFYLQMKPAGSRAPRLFSEAARTPLTAADGPFVYAQRVYKPRSSSLRPARWVDREHLAQTLPTGKTLLGQLQASVAGNVYVSPGHPEMVGRRGDEGCAEEVRKHAVIRVPEEVLLRSAIDAASESGFTLGFKYSFIATGQTGPTVYLLDDADQVLLELGQDYFWHAAIAEAHARLPEAVAKLREAGYGNPS